MDCHSAFVGLPPIDLMMFMKIFLSLPLILLQLIQVGQFSVSDESMHSLSKGKLLKSSLARNIIIIIS